MLIPYFITPIRTPIVMNYIGNNADTSVAASSKTFSAESIGAAATDRVVVLAIALRFTAGSGTISSVTIGGVTATQAVFALNSTNSASIYYAKVSSGTTADIVISTSVNINYVGVGIYTYTGGNSIPAVTDTVTDTTASFSTTMSVAEGGVIIAAAATLNGTTSRFTFSGVSEDFEATYGSSNEQYGAGHLEYASASTPTVGNVVANSNLPVTSFASFE